KKQPDVRGGLDQRALELLFVRPRALSGRNRLRGPERIQYRVDVKGRTGQREHTRQDVEMGQLESSDNRCKMDRRFEVLAGVYRPHSRDDPKQCGYRSLRRRLSMEAVA